MSDGDLGFPEKSDPDEPTAAQPPIVLPASGEQQPPIVLPAPEGQQPSFQPQQQPPSGRRIRPEDMVRRPQSALPSNPIARIGHLWKNDPAYRVLFIAISVVILSSLTCFVVFASMFNQPSSHSTQRSGTNTQQAINAGGVNTGSPTSAVTPISTTAPTPTPATTPTPTPMPTPTPVTNALTVRITSIPQGVQSGATVSVNVTTSEPGVAVQLSITYSALPSSVIQQTNAQNTDSQGNATITWNVQRVLPGTAEVTAIAQDQQGHPVKSPPVTVTVTF
jgi:hypothetical protein